MATKKTTAKAEADEKALYVDEKTLKEMLQKAKEEAFEEFKSELKKEMESEKPKVSKAEEKSFSQGYVPETKEQLEWANEKVKVIVPLDANAPDEINLTINGHTIQVLRGYEVEIQRKYALVLDNMIKQQMASKRYQDEIRSQITYVE